MPHPDEATSLLELKPANSSDSLKILISESIKQAQQPISTQAKARFVAAVFFAVLPLNLSYSNAYRLGGENVALSLTFALSTASINFLFSLFANPKVINFLAKSDWKTIAGSSILSSIISSPTFVLEYYTGNPEKSIWTSIVVTTGIWFLNQLFYTELTANPLSQHTGHLWQSYRKDENVRLTHAKSAFIASSKRLMTENLQREFRGIISGKKPLIFEKRSRLFKATYYTGSVAGFFAVASSWFGYYLSGSLDLKKIMKAESLAPGFLINTICMIPSFYLGSIYGFSVVGKILSTIIDLAKGALNCTLDRSVLINALQNKLKIPATIMLAIGLFGASLSWGSVWQLLRTAMPAIGIKEGNAWFTTLKWGAILGTIGYNAKPMPGLIDNATQTLAFLGVLKVDKNTTNDILIQRALTKLCEKISSMSDDNFLRLLHKTKTNFPAFRDENWKTDFENLANTAPLAREDRIKMLTYYSRFFTVERQTLENAVSVPTPLIV